MVPLPCACICSKKQASKLGQKGVNIVTYYIELKRGSKVAIYIGFPYKLFIIYIIWRSPHTSSSLRHPMPHSKLSSLPVQCIYFIPLSFSLYSLHIHIYLTFPNSFVYRNPFNHSRHELATSMRFSVSIIRRYLLCFCIHGLHTPQSWIASIYKHIFIYYR